MPVIRDTQFTAFREAQAAKFEERVLDLLHRHWPETSADLGESALLARAHSAIERAKGYGLSEEPDLLRYLNITFALGADFDRNGRYPWAAALLADREMHASARVDRLVEWTQKTLETR